MEAAMAAMEAAAAMEVPPDAVPWYCTTPAGEHFGPLSAPELRQLYEAGSLPPEATFCTEGMSEWLPLADVAAALGIDLAAAAAAQRQAEEATWAAAQQAMQQQAQLYEQQQQQQLYEQQQAQLYEQQQAAAAEERREWYYVDAYQQTFGPVATVDLRAMHQAGALPDDALFSTEGLAGWLPFPQIAGYLGLDARAAGQQWAGSQWRDAVGAERQHFERAVVEADARRQIEREAEARAAEAARAQALLSDGLGSSGRMGFLGRGAR